MSKVININATDKHYKKIISDHVKIILQLEKKIELLKTLLTTEQLKQITVFSNSETPLSIEEEHIERLKKYVTE